MQSTLADSLEVVVPSLPAALISPEVLPHLRELARTLAPIPHCGFETQLLEGTRVDLQQCVLARDAHLQQLSSHLRRQLTGTNQVFNPSWRRLDDFLAQLRDPASVLHESIVDLWLEFDQTPTLSHCNLPSMFFGFHRKRFAAPDRFANYAVAKIALDTLLGRSSWMSYQANLKTCFRACEGPVFVSYIGVMLGRPLPALRVNVKCLSPDRLKTYLQRVGWSSHTLEPVEMMHQLYPFFDRITVCLDVGERVYPQISFEGILDEQPPLEARWHKFLDYLIEQGWCTAAKRDALLAWPGLASPADSDIAWPDNLVHHSLLQPPDHFTSLERKISHIKIVCRPEQQPEAKTYFGFLHSWLQPRLDQPGVNLACVKIGQRGTEALNKEGLSAAIQRAITFLLASRTDARWWRDFSGTVGATPEWRYAFSWSDEWVTAFVGATLAVVSDVRAQQAARRAWSFLANRRQITDGWGYNAQAPVDADSTSWGLRLANVLGLGESARAQQARRVLKEHMLPDGGITTYREACCPRVNYPSLVPANGSYGGWCRTAHPCVTAGAAILDNERALNFLRRTQSADGSWKVYWWEDEEYSTALASEALAQTGRAADQVHLLAAVRWALKRIGPHGAVSSLAHGGDSPFATAWCVQLLALAEDLGTTRKPLEQALTWLLPRQRTNGSWASSARLIAPRPDVMDRAESPLPPAASLDEASIFTTATVLSALVSARSRLYDGTCVW